MAVVGLTLAACTRAEPASTSSSTTTRPPDVVLSVSSVGCWQNNCSATMVLWSDGKLEVFARPPFLPSLDGLAPRGEPTLIRELDPGIPDALIQAVAGANWEDIIAQLPAGRCMACVDGVDLLVSIPTSDGIVTINSAATAFDRSIPEIDVVVATVAEMWGLDHELFFKAEL